MIVFKILQVFLWPSVFVPLLILIGLILFLKSKKKNIGKRLMIAGIIFYYLFSITPITDLILLPLEKQYPRLQKEEFDRADKIVLLLGGKESNVLRVSEVLRLYFKELRIKNQELKIIISGRDPLNPEIKEAEKVKEFLVERGISLEDVILEDKSRNTFESAKNVKELVGRDSFFLVTSASHMPRAIKTFQKMGMNPIAAPTDFKIERQYNILDFFPTANNLKNSDAAFHEYFGILFYRIFLI